jgi:hypothetical protein
MKDNPNRSIPLDDLLKKLVEAAALSFEQAHPIPAAVSHSQAFLEHEAWLAKFKTYMEVANGEDKALVEALHRGSGSPILPAGTYHPIERNLWQFSRYLARVCAGHRG